MSKQETMQNVWSIRATKFKTPIQRGAAVPSEPFHIQKVCWNRVGQGPFFHYADHQVDTMVLLKCWKVFSRFKKSYIVAIATRLPSYLSKSSSSTHNFKMMRNKFKNKNSEKKQNKTCWPVSASGNFVWTLQSWLPLFTLPCLSWTDCCL